MPSIRIESVISGVICRNFDMLGAKMPVMMEYDDDISVTADVLRWTYRHHRSRVAVSTFAAFLALHFTSRGAPRAIGRRLHTDEKSDFDLLTRHFAKRLRYFEGISLTAAS